MSKNYFVQLAEGLDGTVELAGVFYDLAGRPHLKVHAILRHEADTIAKVAAAFDGVLSAPAEGLIADYADRDSRSEPKQFISLSLPLSAGLFNQPRVKIVLFTDLAGGSCLTSLIVAGDLQSFPVSSWEDTGSPNAVSLSEQPAAGGQADELPSLAASIAAEGFDEFDAAYQVSQHFFQRRRLNRSERAFAFSPAAPKVKRLPVYEPEISAPAGAKKICLATTDLVGPLTNGGIGTFYTLLAKTLVEAGHEVTVLYDQGTFCERGKIEDWIRHYAQQGITLVPLPNDTALVKGENLMRRSYRLYQWLQVQSFDAIHFHEMLGSAYYSLLAKRHGLAFSNTTLFVECHSPFKWHREHNYFNTPSVYQLEADIREKASIEYADVALFPSRYLSEWVQEQGWAVPRHAYVLPYPFIPQLDISAGTEPPRGDREVVFFGRLEFRKGLDLFCDAIDRLVEKGLASLVDKITFLGKEIRQDDFSSRDYICKRAAGWPLNWNIISDYSRDQAISYLQAGKVLAVVPSRSDNSPFVIYECLAFRIPFLASSVGGIPELVPEEERRRCLFRLDPADLAAKLENTLRSGPSPVHPAFDFADIRERWVNMHLDSRLGIRRQKAPIFRRQRRTGAESSNPRQPAISLILAGPYTNERRCFVRSLFSGAEGELEVVHALPHFKKTQYDNELQEEAAVNGLKYTMALHPNAECTRAELQNFAAAHATGTFLLFMQDNVTPNGPWQQCLLRAADSASADIFTSFGETVVPLGGNGVLNKRISTCLALGGALVPSALRNYQGEDLVLIRRESFLDSGGFDGAGSGAFWPLISRMLAQGYSHDVIPAPLFDYRFSSRILAKRDPYIEQMEAHQEFLDHLPRWARCLPDLSASLYYRLHDQEKRHRQIGEMPSPSIEFRWLPERFSESKEILLTADASDGYASLKPLTGVRVDGNTDVLELYAFSESPQLLLDKFEFPDSEAIGVRLVMTAPEDTIARIYFAKRLPGSAGERPYEAGVQVRKGTNHVYFEVEATYNSGFFRFQPGSVVGPYTVHRLELRALEHFSYA